MKSRSILVAFLVSLGVGSAASADGWVYWMEEDNSADLGSLNRKPLLGGATEVVIPLSAAFRATNNLMADGTNIDTPFRNMMVVDDVGGKIYWWENNAGRRIMFANLDGSNATVFAEPQAGLSLPSRLFLVREPAMGTVPAVSDVGLAVLVLCLLAAGGSVIARRSRVAA